MAALARKWTPSLCATRRSVSSWKAKAPLDVGFVGAPFCGGQKHGGLEESPDLMRRTTLFEKLQKMGHKVHDEGDVVNAFKKTDASTTEVEPAKNFFENLHYNATLSAKVCSVIQSGKVCVTVGGDHAVGLGTVYGHAKANTEQGLALLWVDAHGDIETTDLSPSKNMHGMPVSFHVKELFEDHYGHYGQHFEWFRPCLRPKDVFFVGLRALESCEVDLLEFYNIKYLDMGSVDRIGIVEAVKFALETINPGGKKPLHVSFDIDALDPLEAPATGTPVPGGLSLREGLSLMEEVSKTNCLRGLDLVEINPKLAKTPQELDRTVEAGKRIILAGLGFPRYLSAYEE